MATAFNDVVTARAPLPFVHPADMGDVYALQGQGDCLAPVVKDGSLLVFDQRQQPVVGDLVGLVFTEAAARRGGVPGMVKRLAMALPPPALFGARNMIGLVVVEMINPPRRLTFRTDEVLAVHKCVGFAERDQQGRAAFDPRQAPPRIEQGCGQ